MIKEQWRKRNLACKMGFHVYKIVDGTISLVPITPQPLVCIGPPITVHRYVFKEKCQKCCKWRVCSF